MRTGILIFARLDSRRLPGKALRPIGGRPMLGRVIDRARLIQAGAPLVVATSDRDADALIAEFALRENVAVFRGSAHDVAARALACAEEHGFDRFARICGDSPFLDPALFERMLDLHGRDRPDLVTNTFPRSYPVGQSAEIVSTNALRRLLVETDDPEDREHVTRYFYNRPERFSILNCDRPEGSEAAVRLVVDDGRDAARAEWIASRLEPPLETVAADLLIRLAREFESASVTG